jgi:hypothetical protein
MTKDELKSIIIDLWNCMDEDTFIKYLQNKGLIEEEINSYLEQLDKIVLK